MNTLFSKSEIKKLKDELRKQKRKGNNLEGISGLYSAISNIERHNSYTSSNKVLK